MLLDRAPRRKLEPEGESDVEAVIFTDGYVPDVRKRSRAKHKWEEYSSIKEEAKNRSTLAQS